MLQKLTNTLVRRQKNSSGFLGDVVDITLAQRPLLKQPMFQLACGLSDPTISKNKFRRLKIMMENFHKPSSSAHNHFLRCLYPLTLTSSFSLGKRDPNTTNYISINHHDLYNAYTQFPEPKPLHIPPKELDLFLHRMMSRRDFVKPNWLSADVSELDPETASRFVKQMLQRRQKHIDAFTSIIDDMRTAGLPLCTNEKNYLVYMTFFKDSPEMIENLKQAMPQIESKYTDFTELAFEHVLKSFEPPLAIETLNTMLFLAVRHKNYEVVKKVQSLISDPDLTTYRLLLELYSQQKDAVMFSKTVDDVCDSGMSVDTRIVNTVIRGAVELGQVDAAVDLACRVFLSEVPEYVPVKYKALTAEDDAFVEEYSKVYESLEKALPDEIPQYKLVPTPKTFKYILRYYCRKGSFEQVGALMDILEKQLQLPLTTKDFVEVFAAFSKRPVLQGWNVENLNLVTGKLLSVHSVYNSVASSDSILANLDRISLPDSVNSFIHSHVETKEEMPKNAGSLVKLTQGLMQQVLRAYATVGCNALWIKSETQELELSIAEIRNRHGTGKFFKISEMTYVKQNCLMRLLEQSE